MLEMYSWKLIQSRLAARKVGVRLPEKKEREGRTVMYADDSTQSTLLKPKVLLLYLTSTTVLLQAECTIIINIAFSINTIQGLILVYEIIYLNPLLQHVVPLQK